MPASDPHQTDAALATLAQLDEAANRLVAELARLRQELTAARNDCDARRSAQLREAKVFVLAIDDVEASLRTAELVRRHFPHVQIVARARNRFHASRLMDMGIERQIREALPSSLEMARWTLELLHEPPALVDQMVSRFARHDAEVLARQQAIDHDEGKLIQSSKEAREELVQILEEAREAFTRKVKGV